MSYFKNTTEPELKADKPMGDSIFNSKNILTFGLVGLVLAWFLSEK